MSSGDSTQELEPVLWGSGIGFIIGSHGRILTAAHVVDHADEMLVKRRIDNRYRIYIEDEAQVQRLGVWVSCKSDYRDAPK